MGQATSSGPGNFQRTVTREELSRLFTQHCARELQAIELVSLRRNLERIEKDLKNKSNDGFISETDFETLLKFPENEPLLYLRQVLFGFITKLAQFPLLGETLHPLTVQGLLKAITLLSRERCMKLLGGQFDYNKLIFAALATKPLTASSSLSPETLSLIIRGNPGKVVWGEIPSVKTFAGLDFNSLEVSGDEMLELVAFLLSIMLLQPMESLRSVASKLSKFDEYKKHALPIIKAMNADITINNAADMRISFDQFLKVIENVAPFLLTPLSSLLEALLYDLTNEEVESDVQVSETHRSRLIDSFSRSQLSTYFPPSLIFSNIRKLYVGRDSGFSMRSFESKVFKWNAPTILLLRGSRITSAKIKANPRYRKFEQIFPQLTSSAGIEPSNDIDETIVYAVYVDQPWRVSNKETFGNEKTVIVQLFPVQRVFVASISARNFVYFSTLGGGIGIGSQLPVIRGNNELVRYNPGNVSMTVDSSLEFAVFRNLGIGGELKNVIDDDKPFEDRFFLSDVEVWGCGGEKELEEQNKRWEWEQQEAKRRQQINLKSIGEDRALLEMAGLVGQNQSGGSV